MKVPEGVVYVFQQDVGQCSIINKKGQAKPWIQFDKDRQYVTKDPEEIERLKSDGYHYVLLEEDEVIEMPVIERENPVIDEEAPGNENEELPTYAPANTVKQEDKEEETKEEEGEFSAPEEEEDDPPTRRQLKKINKK